MFDIQLAEVQAAKTTAARLRAYARLENAACAARLSSMADMLAAAYAAAGSAEREQWRFDNWSAVCAQIGATHGITSGVASGLLMDAVALAERLPDLRQLFAAGALSYKTVHIICTHTMMVKDPDARRAIDTALATEFASGHAMSVDQIEKAVDTVVLTHDPLAVRRSEATAHGHRADVFIDDASGTAQLSASLSVADGMAVDKRADALARTVCQHDPRSLDMRRAAALGAMGFGWDRLPCLCEREDCEAAAKPPAGGVVIYVVARQDAVQAPPDPPADGPPPGDGDGDIPGGAPADSDPAPGPELQTDPEPEPEPDAPPVGDLAAQRRALVSRRRPLFSKPWYLHTWPELISGLRGDRGEFCPVAPGVILDGPVVPAPVIAQLALHATLRPLIHPGQAPPEPRYRPSTALARFVRCRDRTCRFPGCTRTVTDIDHTIPYPYGPTAASNLVCLCREHHMCKTFWAGWRSRQFPDGTLEWTDPDGETHTTRPGSRSLFPELCAPTAEMKIDGPPPRQHTARLTMPRRERTRAQDRAQRIDDERQSNIAWVEQYRRELVAPF
ncbi:HNH endonuclease signature motif containing protein [Mycolicibacterium sp. P9-22]|uniref:HNH endonuclease signature motif containing protein n=1 Tax=Mycolicibacterium sp. P9-22 TaxID=2024613 RepID=UPI0011EE673F|nr:HNH endonuclease signature motif containing protein [Mycolicibacterium sp. P9-22]KAA0117228.1 HNH endonuclease [Mycolicibacterium sp. P9-22]